MTKYTKFYFGWLHHEMSYLYLMLRKFYDNYKNIIQTQVSNPRNNKYNNNHSFAA